MLLVAAGGSQAKRRIARLAADLLAAMPMATPIPIGIACPVPGKRAAVMAWLAAAGYTPVPMLDLRSLARDLERRPIEALVADAEAVAKAGLRAVLKILTSNRPLVVVGPLEGCPPELRHKASWLEWPISADALTMRVALALAEGRPTRRSARKSVLYLPATIDGVVSQVIDVSNEGVRLQLQNTTPSTLPPYFTLRVDVFGVATLVQRAWVARPGEHMVVCGGRIERHLPRSKAWAHLVAMAPAAASTVTEI